MVKAQQPSWLGVPLQATERADNFAASGDLGTNCADRPSAAPVVWPYMQKAASRSVYFNFTGVWHHQSCGEHL